MKQQLTPHIKSIRLKTAFKNKTLKSLSNRLNNLIGKTGYLKKIGLRRYDINTGIIGEAGHIRLEVEPNTSYPHASMLLTPDEWRLTDTKRIRKQLDKYLGKFFVERFLKGAATEEIKVTADLPLIFSASDIAISRVQKTYCNYSGVFQAIKLPRYQAELHISAHTVDKHGDISTHEYASHTRLTISLHSFQSQHTFDTKHIHRILGSLRIEYMSGLSNLIPENYLERGSRIGLEDATQNENNVKALFDSLTKDRTHLAWPAAFFRSWTHALKKLDRIQKQ